MKNFIVIFIMLFVNLSYLQASEKIIVTISQTIAHPALDNTLRGINDELIQKFGKTNIKIIVKNAQGNVVLANQIAKQFVALKPNVMIGIGTLSAQSLVRNNVNTPIIFSSVTDPITSQIVKLEDNSNLVCGISNYIDPKIQFYKLKKLLPTIKLIGVIVNPGEANSSKLLKLMRNVATESNIEIVNYSAINTKEVASATAQLVQKKVDAIFINNDNTALAAFSSIVTIANKYKIPVISSDLDSIEQGATIAIGPDQYQIGVETAKLAISKIDNMNVNSKISYPNGIKIETNKKQIKKLNLAITQQKD